MGLLDWSIRYKVRAGDGDAEAQVAYRVDARTATMTAYTNVEDGEPAVRVALHEMLHLVLADALNAAARRGDDAHPDVAREEHRAIERLINVIAGPL